MKRCGKCGVFKPLEQYGPSWHRKDHLQNWCAPCRSEAQRARKARNPNFIHMQRRQDIRRYGISTGEYDYLLSQQQGGCAICGKKCGTRSRLSIDHDHATNKVRGLLCMMCNAAIGGLQENPILLEIAAVYLRNGGTYTAPDLLL